MKTRLKQIELEVVQRDELYDLCLLIWDALLPKADGEIDLLIIYINHDKISVARHLVGGKYLGKLYVEIENHKGPRNNLIAPDANHLHSMLFANLALNSSFP